MLIFKRFEPQYSDLIKNWLKLDVDGMKFLDTYVEPKDYINLIDFKKRYLWIVEKSNVEIGFFDFEIESEEIGYFAMYVAPEFRGKNLGTNMLEDALTLSEVKTVKNLEGGVEKDNEASKKTLERMGFKYSYMDEDGMLMYQLKLNTSNESM